MTPRTIMIVAVDPSADANAADLAKALAQVMPGAQFIGAGGAKMAQAGVQLSFNLTEHAVIGPVDALKNLGSFLKRRQHLVRLALERRPDLIILVDSFSFNNALARAIKCSVPTDAQPEWKPIIVQYTSPQVWASRPGRAEELAENMDLLLSIFPFEKDWYAKRGTPLRVEFVGHPIFDRFPPPPPDRPEDKTPTVVLLPGSRTDELKRHLPVMLAAAHLISIKQPVHFKLVAANEKMADDMRAFRVAAMPKVEIQTGHIADALSTATVAITKTGTITLECAYFGVPTVAIYKTSPLFYLIARQFVTVKYLAMPNLLADEAVFPEFIQGQATPENLAQAALDLLSDPARRSAIRSKLRQIVQSLGGPGSNQRAAALLLQLTESP